MAVIVGGIFNISKHFSDVSYSSDFDYGVRNSLTLTECVCLIRVYTDHDTQRYTMYSIQQYQIWDKPDVILYKH